MKGPLRVPVAKSDMRSIIFNKTHNSTEFCKITYWPFVRAFSEIIIIKKKQQTNTVFLIVGHRAAAEVLKKITLGYFILFFFFSFAKRRAYKIFTVGTVNGKQ